MPHHQGTGLPVIAMATGLENFANFCADMSKALPSTNLSPVSHPITALDEPVFVKIPQGCYISSAGDQEQHTDTCHNDTSHYLKLKCNLYGCRQAAKNWFKHLTAGIIKEGITQSQTDLCLFFCEN